MNAGTTNGLEIKTVTTESEFALSPGWDDLVVASPRPSPFMLHDWLLEWWRHYGRDADLAVSVARRDGRLVAALPLFVRHARGVRVAEFIGGNHSELADLLLLDAADDEAAQAVMDRASAGAYDFADLYGLRSGSRLGELLGSRLELIERSDAPVLDLSKGWDAGACGESLLKRRYAYRRKAAAALRARNARSRARPYVGSARAGTRGGLPAPCTPLGRAAGRDRFAERARTRLSSRGLPASRGCERRAHHHVEA